MTLKSGRLRSGLRNISTGVPAIPDSAIHRWKVGEGGGTTIADSIGSQDGTVNGATWVTGTWQDGDALDHDGTDDNTNCGYVSAFDSPPFAVAFTVEPQTVGSDDARFIDHFDGSVSSGWMVRLDETDNNKVQFTYANADTDTSSTDLTGSTALTTDGTKYRVVVNFDPSGTVALYLNTAEDASAAGESYTATDGSLDLLWAENNQGGSNLDAILDDVIWYDSTLSASEVQEDYDAQPWT